MSKQEQPDPVVLGGFLALQLCEMSSAGFFGLKPHVLDGIESVLPDNIKETTRISTFLYLTWLFRGLVIEKYGIEFADSMMTETHDKLTQVGELMGGFEYVGKWLIRWMEQFDRQTANLGLTVRDVDVPFEVFVAGSCLVGFPESPYYREDIMEAEDIATRMEALDARGPDLPMDLTADVAQALGIAKRRALPLIEALVTTGGHLHLSMWERLRSRLAAKRDRPYTHERLMSAAEAARIYHAEVIAKYAKRDVVENHLWTMMSNAPHWNDEFGKYLSEQIDEISQCPSRSEQFHKLRDSAIQMLERRNLFLPLVPDLWSAFSEEEKRILRQGIATDVQPDEDGVLVFQSYLFASCNYDCLKHLGKYLFGDRDFWRIEAYGALHLRLTTTLLRADLAQRRDEDPPADLPFCPSWKEALDTAKQRYFSGIASSEAFAGVERAINDISEREN